MYLGALVALAVLVVLVACPVANNEGGGPEPGPDPRPGPSTGQPYLCDNGTPVDGSTDAAGQTRCASCNAGYTLLNEACLTAYAYVCEDGTPSSLDATVDSLTRCDSCNAGYTLLNEVCLTAYAYVCEDGTPSSLDATVDSLTRCASCDPLYRLIGTTDVVGRNCGPVAVGEATRIGTVRNFGVNERLPFGLAAVDGTLYMLGENRDLLFTLDTATGRAARVGRVTEFGVGERSPTGLAAISSTLYMVGSNADALYTLNIDSTDGIADGSADRVGSTAQFGVSEDLPAGLAAIGPTLYMVGSSTDALYILNIDPADGTDDGRAIQVGSTTSGFGVGEDSPTGLAAIGNTLYMAGLGTDVLYTLNIDPADGIDDGRATQVGRATQFGVNEGFPTGLAAIDGILYMVGLYSSALYALRYQ